MDDNLQTNASFVSQFGKQDVFWANAINSLDHPFYIIDANNYSSFPFL